MLFLEQDNKILKEVLEGRLGASYVDTIEGERMPWMTASDAVLVPPHGFVSLC